MQKRVHFKMYKAGKHWVVAGLMLMGIMGLTTNIQADEVQKIRSSQVSTSSVEVDSADQESKSTVASSTVTTSVTRAESGTTSVTSVASASSNDSQTTKQHESANTDQTGAKSAANKTQSASQNKVTNSKVNSESSSAVATSDVSQPVTADSVTSNSSAASQLKPQSVTMNSQVAATSITTNIKKKSNPQTAKLASRATNLNLLADDAVTNSNFLTTAKNLASQGWIDDYTQKNGQAATVVLIQNWLNTYRVISLAGVNIINSDFSGSIAAIAGGIHVVNTAAHITAGNDNQWATIANGGLSVTNNTITFETGKTLADQAINNQEMDYSKPRPTGNGAIKGINTSQVVVEPQELNVADFYQAFANLSGFYSSLLDKNAVLPNKNYGNLAKSEIGQTGTRDVGTSQGKHVYVVNLDLAQWPNLATLGFTNDDIVIYNIVGAGTSFNTSGGYGTSTDNLIWNFATATRINNTATIKGKIVAPHAVVTTNQNVDSAGVLQYGYGGSGATQSAIAVQTEVNLKQYQKVTNTPLDYLYAVIDKNGNVYDTPTALQRLTGLKYTITDCQTGQTLTDLSTVNTDVTGSHRYKIVYEYDGHQATTYLNIVADGTPVKRSTITVNYIDESDTIISTKQVSGDVGKATNLTVKIPDLYELDGEAPVLPTAFGDADQTVTIKIKAQQKALSDESRTVTQTIHYVMVDGTVAPTDHQATKTFTRTRKQNLVTQVISYGDWLPATSTFDQVDSPVLTGYTANRKTVATSTVKVTDTDAQHAVTVTYTPNLEKATVTYIDDTTGATLHVENLTGNYNTVDQYQTKSLITDFQSKGYALVSDDYPVNGVSYILDQVTQNFVVHLKQQTKSNTETKLMTRTITYRFENGKQAQSPVTQSVTYERVTTTNKVTGEVTYTDWTSTQPTLAAVETLPIKGYTADQQQVAELTTTATSEIQSVVVTYQANQESAQVVYVDTTTGATLRTDQLHGQFGSVDEYRTTESIAEYEKMGYQLISDEYPTAGLAYDFDGHQPVFKIRLAQIMDQVPVSKTVMRTINYQLSDNPKLQPDTVQQIVTFTGMETVSRVTKKSYGIVWQNSTATLAEVVSPTIAGHTPDRPLIESVPVTPDGPATLPTETVVYTANQEQVQIVYFDDTIQAILETSDLKGKFGSVVDYQTAPIIEKYHRLGYQLVKDDYSATAVVYGEKPQKFVVHLRQSDPVVTLEKEVRKQAVHYQFVDGQQAKPDQVNEVEFSRTVSTNPVTGKITYGIWRRLAETPTELVSPKVTGYTPDQSAVQGISHYGDGQKVETIVIYHPNKEHATVTYRDDTIDEDLQINELAGDYGTTSNYRTTELIGDFQRKGYDLVSDDYPETGVQYHQDGKIQQFLVHLKHRITDIVNHGQVAVTVHYQNSAGHKVSADEQVPLYFSRHQWTDSVTGQVANEEWQRDPGQQLEIESPIVTGYTSDKRSVDLTMITMLEPTVEFDVTYQANRETAVVKYLDRQTGQVLATDKVTGEFGTTASYRTAATIASLTKQEYQVVNDNYPVNGVVFDQDGVVKEFVIYLNKVSQPENPGKPEEPGKPAKPGKPEEPSKPEEPENPGKPEEPSKPEEPNKPEDPTAPVNPVIPDTPSEPETPEVAGPIGRWHPHVGQPIVFDGLHAHVIHGTMSQSLKSVRPKHSVVVKQDPHQAMVTTSDKLEMSVARVFPQAMSQSEQVTSEISRPMSKIQPKVRRTTGHSTELPQTNEQPSHLATLIGSMLAIILSGLGFRRSHKN